MPNFSEVLKLAKNGLTTMDVYRIFGYCHSKLQDNINRLTSYLQYKTREASKTKHSNNKAKSVSTRLQQEQERYVVEYYINHLR